MIIPLIHRSLRRRDLARLITEIGLLDPASAQRGVRQVETGQIDELLDSDHALTAVRGLGGAPAALPLTLLWYIPVRATLRGRGETDIDLADFTATLPVFFVSAKAVRRVAAGEPGLATWTQAIDALPRGSVGRAERAAYCGALALWWAGCFPERIKRSGGDALLRAYGDFAAAALDQAADALTSVTPAQAALYRRAAERAVVLLEALHEVRADYLGPGAHNPNARMRRFLDRLSTDQTE